MPSAAWDYNRQGPATRHLSGTATAIVTEQLNAWGANTRSRGNLVLVDEPTEEIAPLDVRHDANLRDRRSSLGSQELKPSMRPLPVVVLHVGPQNPVQVPGAEDQLPVQTVGAQRLHPAL